MHKSLAVTPKAIHSLSDIFDAKSVAVVGASVDPGKAGYQVLKTLLTMGYKGKVFAVNPKEREILGVTCHSSILDIKSPLDLLVISLPATHVLGTMRQAVQRGDIKGAVILSAGFSETAVAEWVEAERELVRLARSAGIRVFGPNCIGIINCESRLSTGFAPGLTFTPGKIGYISQSGATGGAILMMAADQSKPLGYSKFAHIGNMCDVSNLELIEAYGSDPSIDLIVIYMEGVRDGRKLMEIASRVTRTKPIVLFKVGRTDLGTAATLSHTGTLAGSDAVYDAAFKQCGIVRANSLEELVDSAKAISMLPKAAGNRVCVLTEAGGLGITCIDQISRDGVLRLASLGKVTKERLTEILPPMAVVAKPDGYVDITAAALTREHCESLRAILEDPGVDSVVLMTLPPTFLPALEVAKGLGKEAFRDVDLIGHAGNACACQRAVGMQIGAHDRADGVACAGTGRFGAEAQAEAAVAQQTAQAGSLCCHIAHRGNQGVLFVDQHLIVALTCRADDRAAGRQCLDHSQAEILRVGGNSQTVAAASQSGTFVWYPAKCTRPSRPQVFTRSAAAASSCPVPTKTRCTSGKSAATRSKAAMASSGRFSSDPCPKDSRVRAWDELTREVP